jgi:hypothetical protein
MPGLSKKAAKERLQELYQSREEIIEFLDAHQRKGGTKLIQERFEEQLSNIEKEIILTGKTFFVPTQTK